MKTDELAEILRYFLQMPVSCVLREEEKQIIIRVFLVPEEKQSCLEDAIYDLEASFYPNGDRFFSVITYTKEETERYYPDMIAAGPTQSSEEIASGQAAASRPPLAGENRYLLGLLEARFNATNYQHRPADHFVREPRNGKETS
ncbi:MAG: hypothetical protein ACOX9E_12070 [Lentisphaeria bacterium]|jgi:hypothetical protein